MNTLFTETYDTPLGKMVAFANEKALLLFDFEDSKYFQKHLKEISQHKTIVDAPEHKVLQTLKQELTLYFNGKLSHFTVPIDFSGTDFQKKVWKELQNIGFGEYKTYLAQAESMSAPKSVRAVANANSKNKLCIIVPCHRVIGKNRSLTGYAGGIERKAALLKLEGIVL